MKAGRELDALIARKVMGWDIKTITVMDGHGPRSDFGTVDAPRKMPDGRMGVAAHQLPHFSTNVNDAWLVFGKFPGKRHEIWCTEQGLSWARIGYTIQANGETPALAICRAALLAIGFKWGNIE
jgi:ABA sandwich protein